MTTTFPSTLLKRSAIAALVVALSACADMTPRQRDAAIGAGVGGVAGNLVTGGSALGTVGGAAVGGVIGGTR